MKAQFEIKSEGPDGEAYEVVFNATSLGVALEALVHIVEQSAEIFEQLGNSAGIFEQVGEGLLDGTDEE